MEEAQPTGLTTPPAVLSILIPAYNEERYIGTLLERVRRVGLAPLGFRAEIIVVDDHSADRTAALAADVPGVLVERLPANAGKGAAVRAGLRRASGEYVLIQDADLEYDPADHAAMLAAARRHPGAAVYGSRYLRAGRRPGQYLLAYLGGRTLSALASLLTRRRLTDTTTALKLLPRRTMESLTLRSDGFELDQEITMKLAARGIPIVEVPVRYTPRSRSEGKKVGFRDWVKGAAALVRFRRG